MTWSRGEGGGKCCHLVPMGEGGVVTWSQGEGGEHCDLVLGREGCVVTWSWGGRELL